MAEARAEADWSQTSALMALIANVNRPKGKRAYKPSYFDPTRPRNRKLTQASSDLSLLRETLEARKPT